MKRNTVIKIFCKLDLVFIFISIWCVCFTIVFRVYICVYCIYVFIIAHLTLHTCREKDIYFQRERERGRREREKKLYRQKEREIDRMADD